nr:MAG TPA: hypothetical protein [Caudoviricetes sp.]
MVYSIKRHYLYWTIRKRLNGLKALILLGLVSRVGRD